MLEDSQQAIDSQNPRFLAMCKALQITPDEFMEFIRTIGKGINYIYHHHDYQQATPDRILITMDQEPYVELKECAEDDPDRKLGKYLLKISPGYITRHFALMDKNINDINLTVTGDLPLTAEKASILQGVEEAYHVYQMKHESEKWKNVGGNSHMQDADHDEHPMEKAVIPVVRQAAVDLGIAPNNYWQGVQRSSRYVE